MFAAHYEKCVICAVDGTQNSRKKEKKRFDSKLVFQSFVLIITHIIVGIQHCTTLANKKRKKNMAL